jgi:hypothetical protein
MKTIEIYNNSEQIFTVSAITMSDAWAWLAQTKCLSIKQAKDLYKLKIKKNDKRTIVNS